MSDDKNLDSKIDKGTPITRDDILKSISSDRGLRSVNEGYIFKSFSKDTTLDQDKSKNKDN